MKVLSFVIVALMIIIYSGCEKEELSVLSDVLYLKPAELGETTYAESSKKGTLERYRYPNNVLFKICKDSAQVINNCRIKVDNFKLLANNQALFSVSAVKSDISLNETIKAYKLPFSTEDYASQLEAGDERFNGLLKTDNYVLAVNMTKGEIKIVDLNTGKSLINKCSIHNGALYFKIESKIWQLWLTHISPVGNVFQIFVDGQSSLCHSLAV